MLHYLTDLQLYQLIRKEPMHTRKGEMLLREFRRRDLHFNYIKALEKRHFEQKGKVTFSSKLKLWLIMVYLELAVHIKKKDESNE